MTPHQHTHEYPDLQLPRRRRIYLMRHGAVSYYENGRPVPPEGVPLTTAGRAQAASVAGVLADIPFDRAICSGLPRTVETATIVLNGRDLPLEIRPAFEEIRSGTPQDVASAPSIRDLFVGAFERGLAPEDRFLMGETFGGFYGRIAPAYHTLLAEPDWSQLLLVAHGAVNRVILAEATGAGLAGLGHFEQEPACINILDIDAAGFAILRLVNHVTYEPITAFDRLTTMERSLLAAYGRR